jgi:plasmid stabilization system protein ParE
MEEGQQIRKCIVELTESAVLDLASIDNATASNWGEEQANRYTAFLQETIQSLAIRPEVGNVPSAFPELRTYVARLSRKRQSHGHRIVYRTIEDGIRVIRILHTAMQWEDHLDPDIEE